MNAPVPPGRFSSLQLRDLPSRRVSARGVRCFHMAATSTMPASGAAPDAPASVAIVGGDTELVERIGEALEQAGMPSLRAATVEQLAADEPLSGLDVLLLGVSGDETALTEAVNDARAALPGIPLVAVWRRARWRLISAGRYASASRASSPPTGSRQHFVATVQAVSVGLVSVSRALSATRSPVRTSRAAKSKLSGCS